MEEDVERSESGNPIYRYKKRTRPFSWVHGSSDDIEAIESHVTRYLGEIDTVWHEIISDLVHLDVHHIGPTSNRNVHTFVTSGMSDLPMSPPESEKDLKYAELMVTLPANWPVSEDDFRDEANYWPIGLLKILARFPHEYETWLWWGHTIPNGDPPEYLHHSTKFTGAILSPPITVSPEFLSLKAGPDKEIHFFSVIPIYQEEMDLKLRQGTDSLFELFDKHGINEVIESDRRNVAAKKWWQVF